MENRIDRLTAVHVDLAMNVSCAFGLSAAVEASHQLDIPSHVTRRVLIECGPRRGATPDRLGPP